MSLSNVVNVKERAYAPAVRCLGRIILGSTSPPLHINGGNGAGRSAMNGQINGNGRNGAT